MDEVLTQKPSTAPPALTASIPEDTPGPSDQQEEDDDVEEEEEEESQPGPRRKRKREDEGGHEAAERGWRGSSLLQRTIVTLFLLCS